MVTDQGSLEPYKRHSCLDHVINTVLRHGLDKDTQSVYAPDIGETVSSVKSVVRFTKQSGLAAQLSKTVLQMPETRFSTVCLTPKSVHEVCNELCEKLQARGEEERMDNTAPEILPSINTLRKARQEKIHLELCKRHPSGEESKCRFYECLRPQLLVRDCSSMRLTGTR